ncbi:MAG: MTH865 family protein [Thermoleophilia bacterium]
MDVRSELKSQIVGALAGASFPIATPEALLAAFPQGADTTCEAGDVKLRAGDAGGVLTAADFPFTGAEQVADSILSRALA